MQHRRPPPGGLPSLAAVALVVGLTTSACPRAHTAGVEATENDAAVPPADDSTAPEDGGATKKTLAQIVRELVESHDRVAEVTCPCSVQTGTYDSMQECLRNTGSLAGGPDCLTRALEPYDSPTTRASLACMAAHMEEDAFCYAETACGASAWSRCGSTPLDCFGDSATFTFSYPLFAQCPETPWL